MKWKTKPIWSTLHGYTGKETKRSALSRYHTIPVKKIGAI